MAKHNVIRSILYVPHQELPQKISSIIAENEKYFTGLVTKLRYKNRYLRLTEGEAKSVIYSELMELVNVYRMDPSLLDKTRDWQRLLAQKSYWRADALRDDYLYHGLGSISGLKRRQKNLKQTHARLLAHGYSPTTRELIEETNKAIEARVSNPVKQGMVTTVNDLTTGFVDYSLAEHHSVVENVQGLDPLDIRELFTVLKPYILTSSPVVRDTAFLCWMAYVSNQPFPTIREVSTELSVSRQEAALALLRLQALTRRELRKLMR